MSSSGPGATLLLSFDCEGKWGAADHLTPHHHEVLTNRRLTEAYEGLVELLAAHRLRASFAFVGLFLLSPEEQDACRPWFEGLLPAGRRWVAAFEAARARGDRDGWSNPELLDLVDGGGGHEIASHGFSHLVIDDGVIGREDLRYELAGLALMRELRGLSFSTLVYPRNVKGYPGELPEAGFLGYRDSIPTTGPGWLSFARELKVLQRSEPQARPGRPIAIPGGAFLNWRARLRRRIPMSVTVRRWKSALHDAVRRGGVVHIWSHPHNFIDGAGQFELFDRVLGCAAELVASGDLVNSTQEEYCRRLGTDPEG